MELDGVRRKLDIYDNMIKSMITLRMSLIPIVADIKIKNDMPLFQGKREEQIYHKLEIFAKENGVDSDLMKSIYQQIIGNALTIEEEIAENSQKSIINRNADLSQLSDIPKEFEKLENMIEKEIPAILSSITEKCKVNDLNLNQIATLYYHGKINQGKRFGLIGHPLGHSMSPIIHAETFQMRDIKADYQLIDIAPQDLAIEFVNKLKDLNGFNITIPHKINIIPFLDELSPKADLFGAVNTVDIRNGKAIGYNTDCIGFLRAMEYAKIELGGNVLVCGSGGVSRMFAFESVLAGADVTLAVRNSSLEAAKKLREEIKEKFDKECKIIMLSEAKGGYDLIINGTPAGMYPNVDDCPLAEEVVKSSKAVFDSIYNPLETKLLRYAREGGLKYSNGLSMLVWQAVVAEEIWNDITVSKDEVEKIIRVTEKELEKK